MDNQQEQVLDSSREQKHLISKSFSDNLPINIKEIILNNKESFYDWIYETDNTNAYPYSMIINCIINKKDDELFDFVSNIDLVNLSNRFVSINGIDYYSWGNLFNRIFYVLHKLDIEIPFEIVQVIIEYANSKGPKQDINAFCNFLTTFVHFYPEYIFSILDSCLDNMKVSFENNVKTVFELLDYDFLTSFCGMEFLGNANPTDHQKEYSQRIIQILPLNDMANYISNSYPGEWHFFLYLLGFIQYYSEKTLKDIGREIDLISLSHKAAVCWDNLYEIDDLLEILRAFSMNTAKTFIKMNKDLIQTASPIMCVIAPRLIIDHFNKGKTVELIDKDSGFSNNYYALKRLFDVNQEITVSIINANLNAIAKALNYGTALNFDDNYCLKFLKLLQEISIDNYRELLAKLNKNAIKDNWDRCGGLRSKSATVAKRKREYYMLVEIEC